MTRTEKFGLHLPRTIRGTLLALLLVVLVPAAMLYVAMYYNRVQERRAQELQANLEIARGVSSTFTAFVRDVLHEEFAMGVALTSGVPAAEANQYLSANAKEQPGIQDFSWLSPRGQVLAASEPRAIGLDLGDRSYFQEVARGLDWTVGDLLEGRVTGKLVFIIARGIRDQAGILQGVVLGSVTSESLADLLRVERTGQASIVVADRSGRLVYRYPEWELTWEQRNRIDQPEIQSALAGQEVAGTFVAIDGVRRMGGHVPIALIGWVAGAGRPEAEVMAALRQDIVRDSAAALGVVLGSLLLWLLISRNITSPIDRVREHAIGLGSGAKRRPVTVRGPREVEDLAATFNRMADQIEAREEALRQSEERLRLVIANSPDTILLQDRGLRYSAVVNPHPPFLSQDLLGKTDFELFDKDQAERLSAIKRAVIDTGAGARAEFSLHVLGVERFYETAIEPRGDLGDEIVGVTEYARDITDRKKAEQLRAQYVALISHDLRNPLTVLMGQAEWLQRALGEKGFADEAHSAESIVRNAKRMNVMIQDLIESAQLEAGTLELRREPTDLGRFLPEIVDRVSTREDRGRIRVEVAEAVPPVLADHLRLERAIANLVTNALKYSPADTPVRVRLAKDGANALLAVSDQGTGIPAEEIPHLFQMFYRGRTAQKSEGTGLGLYITRLIVEAHGGKVCVESVVGKGSSFYISLPLQRDERPQR